MIGAGRGRGPAGRARRTAGRGRLAILGACLAACVAGGALLVGFRDEPSGAGELAAEELPRDGEGAADGGKREAAEPRDIYAATRAGMLSPVVRDFPERIYVPNSQSNTVDVIDPKKRKVIDNFAVDALPHHVTPSYDMKKLWVDNTAGNTLTPIDPKTGKRAGKSVPVEDPYNLYYTPDGSYAVVVAERLRRLDFRDPDTMKLRDSLTVPCAGVDHLDYTADGRYMLASCEFSGEMIKVDVERRKVVEQIQLRQGAKPQDVKLSPDGRVFYIADLTRGGVYLIDARSFRKRGFVRTGAGAHGLYPSRDSRHLYVTNRGDGSSAVTAGSVSVLSFATRKVLKTWRLPGAASPDMGGVSADGKTLWLTGRYHGEVYAIDTRSGKLRARIAVGQGPHGLAIFPQPGRYSLGHTGVFR